jgi:hypothetical protein
VLVLNFHVKEFGVGVKLVPTTGAPRTLGGKAHVGAAPGSDVEVREGGRV